MQWRWSVWVIAAAMGCSSSPPAADETSSTTGLPTAGTAVGSESAASGSTEALDSSGPAAVCTALYGRPSPATGLDDDQCRAECPCLDGWVAPTYTQDDVEALRALTLSEPFAELDTDPYSSGDVPPSNAEVCAVTVQGQQYSLASYADEAAAVAAGAKVTHDGRCGLCSPLQDLAVYMGVGDLTEPVRACGVLGLSQGNEANLECLLELGFTLPCAQIWLYNTVHTRTMCLDECLAALDQPYHLPDGSLNPCLRCDEEMSGPVFKAVAGRTRRNTGLASALCRPCDEVRRVEHRYGSPD